MVTSSNLPSPRIAEFAALQHYRQHYPALASKSYFNFGGQGPMAQEALSAIAHAQLHSQQIGPFSHAANGWINHELVETKRAIATELGISPTTLTLTENVTVGCNIPLWGMDWQPGDHVVMSDCEHPGIIATLLELQHRFQIQISTCSLLDTLNEGDPVAAIQEHLRPKTRMVVISHILWNTGQVLPLTNIVNACHTYQDAEHPVLVHVDAAQSVGVLPLRLSQTNVDFYAFTGHKWLCGPAGIGGLYVSPSALESIRPTYIGWRGITKNEVGYPTGWEPDGRRFEVSTSDFALLSAMREAIALHNQWGTATDRYQRICALSHRLWQQLREIPSVHCLKTSSPESGLVSFTVDNLSHAELVHQLEAKGFMLRTLLHPDCIRACVHYFTLESEVDELAALLRSLIP
ncbi:MAG: aminotransferase class V-fold PLP-dependent enzyme [Cyanobacteria bacterium P01_E01_bin.6]